MPFGAGLDHFDHHVHGRYANIVGEVGANAKGHANPSLAEGADALHFFRREGIGEDDGFAQRVNAQALVVGNGGIGKFNRVAAIVAHAIEQLGEWSQRSGCDLVAKDAGSDPSAVMFETVEKAIKEQYDIVICDTAGRLHTKKNLMEELKKMVRVIRKQIPDAPHEVLLVLDATTGQNAIFQARAFREAADLTGLVVTKLDGTAKGGVVIGIVNEFDIPVRYIGIGERLDDLRPFDPEQFAESLLN